MHRAAAGHAAAKGNTSGLVQHFAAASNQFFANVGLQAGSPPRL